MKFSFPVFCIFYTIVLFICIDGFSQQLADEIQSKLSDSDQKKIEKADDTYTRGDLLLYKANYPGDELVINNSEPNGKLNKKFISKRMEAASYYKDANADKYAVYEKNIKDFWKNYTGNQDKLANVKKAEANALDQFQKAQQIRNDANKNANYIERLSLIFKAEENEKNAMVKLQKVLITYLNYPAQYNESWFTEDTIAKVKTPEKIIVPTPQPAITALQPVKETPGDTIKPKADTPKVLSKEIIKGNEQEGEPSLYSMVDVNENQIDAFNQFIQKQYPDKYEKYIIDFSSIDYSDLQSLRNTWYRYKFGTPEDSTYFLASQESTGSPSDTAKHIIAQDLLASETSKTTNDKTPLAQGDKTGKNIQSDISPTEISPEIPASKTKKDKPHTDKVTKKDLTPSETISKPESGTRTNVTSVPVAHGFLFKVQIAACRISLDNNIVSGIYNGNETVNQTFEDDWYKYTIGEYNTYRDARQMRDGLNVPGAFVVAYLNGKRIKITPAVAKKEITEVPLPDDIQPQLIQFRLQVAASKNELSENILKNIYSGSNQILMVYEDDWYRYSILAGNKLSDALELLKTINVPGAFIVTYYNNQKINLRTAIQLTKFN